MPIYEYRCNDCQHKLETLQKFSDAPLVTCPSCGRDALTKLVSAAGFKLKGSGWYQTDFRGNGGAKKPEKSETASESPAGDGSATPSDTAAPKTEAAPSKTEPAAPKPASPPPTTSAT